MEVAHRLAEGSPDSVAFHTHTDVHFILVSGGAYVSAAGKLPCDDQPVLVYNPCGTTHRDHFEGGRGSFFSISLDPDSSHKLRELVLPDEPRYLRSARQLMLARAIGSLCSCPAAEHTFESLCLELVGTLAVPLSDPFRGMPGWLAEAVECLQDRYCLGLSIADVAHDVGVHPVYLARSFRRHFGCTPAAFTRFRRLEKAADLLASSRLALAEVALQSGFADQSQLTTAFRRGLGVTPGRYRELVGSVAGSRARFQIDKTGAAPWAELVQWARSSRTRRRRIR
jgi:AraC family transcriptional regulator